MADLSVTAAGVLASNNAQTSHVVAGETITAGQTVYRKAADGEYYKADANGATAEAKVPVGVALNGASDGQPLKIAREDTDFTPGATITEGTVYIQSATAGGIAPVSDAASGMQVTVIGVGKASNKLSLKPLAGGSVA